MENGNVLAISIVLFCNPREQIQKVIESVRESRIPYQLFLVDNSPRDGFFSWLKLNDNEEYIFLGKNVGFGAGHNVAISKSIELGKRYHLVLNPDVYFGPEVLTTITDFMESNPSVGLLTPKVLYPDGRTQYLCKRLPRPYDLLVRRFGPKVLKEKNNYFFEMRDRNYDEIMEVPSLSGCFMFFRCSVLEEIRGFDERFFMYLEDVDISRRSGAVAKNLHFPKVMIYHEHGQGSYKSMKLLWYHISSVFKYFFKWGLS
ncbi:MAG: glycosyltransferase family 2 protein [Bdellovibrionaceae bacterium]|nr:glycosyltransferase family 2 protein [Pseudobdellovibrionaceae bacterium]